jgi:2-C-methyl-D-erythritol 4-phosphate cytidylyltransferase
MLSLAVESAASVPLVTELIVTCVAGFDEETRACLSDLGVPVRVITGGDSRQSSVRVALQALAPDVEAVAVHDAARPFASPRLFSAVFEAVNAGADGAIPAVKIADTVKRVRGAVVAETISREGLVLAQTPQGFRVSVLRDAHSKAAAAGLHATDDAHLLELAGYEVQVVKGEPENFKITTSGDLAIAEAIMAEVVA